MADVPVYFRLFIDDYLRDAADLTLVEHGAYFRLMLWYYSRAQPIPNDMDRICRRLGAHPRHRAVIAGVLARFFRLESNAWTHKRIQTELMHWQNSISQKRDAADKRWNKINGEDNADALQTHSERNANQNQNQKERTSKDTQPTAESPRLPAADPVPYQEIVALYHEKLPMLPRVAKLTATRKAAIRARWKQGELPDLETWGEFFSAVFESKFLTGRAAANGGRKPFLADLEWLVKESNFVKVWEGKYA